MRKLTAAAVAAALAVPGTAAATGPLGLELGFGAWNHDISGDIEYEGSDFDVTADASDMGFSSETDAMVWLRWHHPVPLLPKLEVRHTRLRHDGSGEAQFNDTTVVSDNDLELDHTDLILYYRPVPLPALDIDLGLNVRYVDGMAEADARDDDNPAPFQTRERESFSGFVPLLYARAEVRIPTTPFAFEAAGSGLSVDDHTLYDWRVGVIWHGPYGLGATVGYREQRIKLDDLSGLDSDVRIDGAYAALMLRY